MDADEQSMQRSVDEAVCRAFKHHHSLGKNGDTLGGWLKKAVSIDKQTLQILAAIGAFIFWFGGEAKEYRDLQNDVNGVIERQTDIERKLDDALALVNEQRMINAAVERNIADIELRLDAVPTRGEWQSMIRQQLMPMRDRIERLERRPSP